MSTGRSAAGTGAVLEARRCAAVASAKSSVMGEADVGIAATEEESATARNDPSSAAATPLSSTCRAGGGVSFFFFVSMTLEPRVE